MQIKLRSIAKCDFEFIYTVTKAAMQHYVEQTWGAWIDEEQRTRIYDSLDLSTHQIVEFEGQNIGCLAVEYHDSHIQLSKLYLLPLFQGRGIGTFLIRRLIAEAQKTNKPIRLRVLVVNPARRFYEREGFVVRSQTAERFYMEYAI